MRTAAVSSNCVALPPPPVVFGRSVSGPYYSSPLTSQCRTSVLDLALPPPPPPPPLPLPPPSSTPIVLIAYSQQPSSNGSDQFAMPARSSYPRRPFFHKLLGSITLMLIVVSIGILVLKRCTHAVASEGEWRDLTAGTAGDTPKPALVQSFVSSYYYKLHILHCFTLSAALLIVLFACVDLVPTGDNDIKFAFHFVSVFAIFCISLSTMYAGLHAYERPCTTETDCCTVVSSPGLFSGSEKPRLTAISTQDIAMMAVMVLDLFAGVLQLVVSVVYFRDVRQEAENCGYLHRVHNEGYIIR